MVCRARIVCGWCAFVPPSQAGDKVSSAGVSWRIILHGSAASSIAESLLIASLVCEVEGGTPVLARALT